MFEDLARSALAVFLFALAGLSVIWALSPLTTGWEIARLRISPRSINDRLSEQSLVGPVITFGAVGLITSGVIGWSVGALLEEFDPEHFTTSARHINVALTALAFFALTAYATNAYARLGAGKPTNVGELLYELQHRDRGFYAADHMDEEHWLALRSSITTPWEAIGPATARLFTNAVGFAPGPEPWKHLAQGTVLAWRESRPSTHNRHAERALARRSWAHRPSQLIRIGFLGTLATATLVLSLDSGDPLAITLALTSIGLAALMVPPLVLRAVRWENRRRTTILLRDLLWSQRAIGLIDGELESLRTPRGNAAPSWSQLLLMANLKLQDQLANPPRGISPARER